MPSKKITYLLSFCIVLVALIISLSSFLKNTGFEDKVLNTDSKNLTVNRNLDSINNTDENNNNIPDWLETIDTEDVEDSYVPGEIDENSISSQLARTIFSNYTEAKNIGEIDESTRLEIIESALGDIEYSPNLSAPYTKEMIVKVEDSKENIKEYANEFIKILMEESQKYIASADNDNLDKTSYTYRTIGERMSKLETPESLAQNQTDISNTYYVMSNLFVEIGKYQSDPVQSLLAYRTIQEVGLRQLEILGKIKDFIKQSDIIFNENDPGSALIR